MGTPTRRPRHLSLYSGIGAGCLGAQMLGWRTMCYVEHDEFCQRVLQERIADGWLDDAPIWDDAKTFEGKPWREKIDILTGGFPCQSFSHAGDQEPESDDRNLWPTTARIIREVRPRVVFLENVANVVTGKHGYFGTILGDLADLGYDVVWDCVQADQFGAPHERRRAWILGVWRWREVVLAGECEDRGGWRECRICGERYATCGCPGPTQEGLEYEQFDGKMWARRKMAHADGERCKEFDPAALPIGVGPHSGQAAEDGAPARFHYESRPVGVVDDPPDRMDRIRAAGNAQVPQQMAAAFALLGRRVRRVLGAG